MAVPERTLTKNKIGVSPKHVPQRMCIACRKIDSKRAFIRVVLTPGGNLEIDETGRKPGRGVYLCHHKSCREKGLNEKTLGYGLRIKISEQALQGIREYMKKLNGNNLGEGENK